MLILPRSLLCYLFWALTLPLYMWLSVPLCVCECVCLFSGLMCALDCAQIAQVQLKLSIQFLSSSYCAIFKNLNSIFIIAVGPLVLSSRNIITPTSSWSSSSGSSSSPSSLSAVALLLLSHWHLIPLFALRLALSHGHLVAYCNVLHSYRCSPLPDPSHSFVFAFPMPTSILHILGAILFHSQWRHSAGALTKWQWKQKWKQEEFESQVY